MLFHPLWFILHMTVVDALQYSPGEVGRPVRIGQASSRSAPGFRFIDCRTVHPFFRGKPLAIPLHPGVVLIRSYARLGYLNQIQLALYRCVKVNDLAVVVHPAHVVILGIDDTPDGDIRKLPKAQLGFLGENTLKYGTVYISR